MSAHNLDTHNEDSPLLRSVEEYATYESNARNDDIYRSSNDLIALGDDRDPVSTPNVRVLYRNFIIMSVAFSCNHGSVVSCLAYATTILGDSLGGTGSGSLYVLYALTAFFLSKPIVSMVGPKNGLMIGVGGYCVYVAGFLFAASVPYAKWPAFILACSIGGIAGGLLWTSQGRYFARNAKLYSDATNIPIEHVNATFAGIFATSYLGLEMVTKVLATALFLSVPNGAKYVVFTTYTAIAIISSIVIASISDLDEKGTWDFSYITILANVTASGKLVYIDPRLSLMLPFQIAFGFASSFVPYYVFGTVVSTFLGSTWVGLLSAIIVLTGSLIAIPSAWVSNKYGKPVVMCIGGACLSIAGLAFFFFSNEQLGTWKLIVPYLVVYGLGRGTWENTNKAVIADFFDKPELSTAAFAAVSFSNGLAGSIGFFSFEAMKRLEMAGLVMAASILAVGCYLAAARIHENEKKNAPVAAPGKYDNI